MIRRAIATLLLVSLPVGCTPTVLPPPQVPERLLPDLPGPPPEPEPNKSQVTIVADEPSTVEEVTGTYEGVDVEGYAVSGLTYATVCAQTPCVTNLAHGDHVLRLTSLADAEHNGTGTISVGERPIAYRYALGHNIEPHGGRLVGGGFLLVYGIMDVIGGPILIGIGKETETNFDGTPGATHDWRPLGVGMTVVGIGLIALAWHMMHHSEGSQQEGAGVQWTP